MSLALSFEMRTACEADSPLLAHLDSIPQQSQIDDGAAFCSELKGEICLFQYYSHCIETF